MKRGLPIVSLAGLLLLAALATSAWTGEEQVQRSTFEVANLSCTSCLTRIEGGLRSLPGALGMTGDVSRGQVVVDHQPDLAAEKIAAAITDIGYPATLGASVAIARPEAALFDQGSRFSGGCGGCSGSGYCNASASEWKQLFRRFFGWP